MKDKTLRCPHILKSREKQQGSVYGSGSFTKVSNLDPRQWISRMWSASSITRKGRIPSIKGG